MKFLLPFVIHLYLFPAFLIAGETVRQKWSESISESKRNGYFIQEWDYVWESKSENEKHKNLQIKEVWIEERHMGYLKFFIFPVEKRISGYSLIISFYNPEADAPILHSLLIDTIEGLEGLVLGIYPKNGRYIWLLDNLPNEPIEFYFSENEVGREEANKIVFAPK